MKPSLIATKIAATFPIDGSPRDIVEVIAQTIRDDTPSSVEEAREQAERIKEKVFSILRREFGELNKKGKPCSYCFNTSSEYLVQGACYQEPGDTAEIIGKKQRRLELKDYKRELTALNEDEFERLCSKVISLIGATDSQVTRRRADEGIDFFGKLHLANFIFPADLTPTVQRQLGIWLVGQAKRYLKLQAGTPDLRDLVGAVVLARAGAFGSKDSALSALKIRVFDPVFAMFITSSTMSSAAWRLLESSGVIGIDGDMLAAFLADRAIGQVGGKFEAAEFATWVRS